jgi:HAD superfamily hydrolase (TIGR01509 family)
MKRLSSSGQRLEGLRFGHWAAPQTDALGGSSREGYKPDPQKPSRSAGFFRWPLAICASRLTFTPGFAHGGAAVYPLLTDAELPLPSLVIFDCDGVLIDSEILSADVLIAELAALDIRIDRAHVRAHYVGRSFPTVARLISEAFARPLPADFEMRYRAALLARFETDLHATAGVDTVLSTLKLPKAVATSSSPPRVARSLAITGLAHHFGADVFTASQVPRGKPFPDIFLAVAERFQTAPADCLVIEDSLPGIEAGLAAGMTVLAYLGGSHMRGQAFTPPAGVRTFDNWEDFPQILTNWKTLKDPQ